MVADVEQLRRDDTAMAGRSAGRRSTGGETDRQGCGDAGLRVRGNGFGPAGSRQNGGNAEKRVAGVRGERARGAVRLSSIDSPLRGNLGFGVDRVRHRHVVVEGQPSLAEYDQAQQ